MMIDSIIFDLDGTLWDASEEVCVAWNAVIARYPDVNKVVTVEDLAGCFGLPLGEISIKLFPEQTAEIQAALLREFSEAEQAYLRERGGRLYDRLEETLEALSKKYKLFIVSNCQDG